MSNPPKIDRKTLKTPDQFIRRGQTTLGFLVQQRNRYIPVAIVAVIGICGYYGYDWWAGRKLDKGWRLYYEATKLSDTAKWERFKSLYSEAPSSRPGIFAAVAVADYYYSLARKEVQKDDSIPSASAVSAAEWYGKALEFGGLQVGEKQLLQVDRGGALEMQKKWDDALRDYEAAAGVDGEGKGWAMLNVGRVWEVKNEPEKAKQTYEKITLEFANSEFAKQAKNYLRRMKSPLFQSVKATNG